MSRTVIFSTGAQGGVGKSTMAILMIEALLEAGQDVSGIEGDEHSPSLHRKYDGVIDIASIDLAALFGDVGVNAFSEAVNSLAAGYIIVNTPATGSRMFDELPQVLRDATWDIRATWCMSIKADRTRDGVEEDGLFESVEEGMLSGLDKDRITAVRPLFQGHRGQKFWYDNYLDLAEGIGLKEMPMKIFSGRALDAIHRDKRPLPEVIADLSQNDPVSGASLQMKWCAMKNSMASTVLAGAELRLDARVVPASTKIYGAGGLVEVSRDSRVTESREAGNVVAEPQGEGDKQMDDLIAVQQEIDRLGEITQVASLAMNGAIALLRGWYQNFKPTPEAVKAWIYLTRDLDPTLFIKAAEEWGRTQPDWAPTGPQFRQMVEQLETEKRQVIIREANVRRIEASKAADRGIFRKPYID